MTTIRWRLNDILQAHNLTAYKLEQAVRGNVSRNTVYRWAKETPQLLDLAALPHVMQALTRLTGQPVTPNDLLEVIEEPEHVFEEMDAETKAWHDADLSHLGSYEPYDWGDIDPMTLGKAVINGVVQE